MLPAALSTIAQRGRLRAHRWTDAWRTKGGLYAQTERYSAFKTDGILTCATLWLSLETLFEVKAARHKRPHVHCMTALIGNVQNRPISRQKAGEWLSGVGEWRIGSVCLMGLGCPSGVTKMSGNQREVVVVQHCECAKGRPELSTELPTLKC